MPTVDYSSVLTRAVAALEPNTGEQRQALYNLARKTLVDELRASSSARSYAAESAALEAAIRTVETAALYDASTATFMNDRPQDPVQMYADRPPLKDIGGRLSLIVSLLGVASIIIAGVATYYFWPRIVSEMRGKTTPLYRSSRAAESPSNASYIYMRQLVYYRTNFQVGTIIVDKSQAFLYVVRPRLAALRYTIGVGTECTALAGLYHVVQKAEWPSTTPSNDSDNAGGLKQSSGARSLLLSDDHLIHGTGPMLANRKHVSERCIGLADGDISDLYDRTPLGNSVVVLSE